VGKKRKEVSFSPKEKEDKKVPKKDRLEVGCRSQ